MSYTEIAAALGITKGRITQIRSGAPRPQRAFFGVGPVAIGVPYRYQTTDRERPLIAAEDAQAGERIERVLSELGFAMSRFQIEPDLDRIPSGDAVVVCGPKSAPLAANLISRDPFLAIEEHDGRSGRRRTRHRTGPPTWPTSPGRVRTTMSSCTSPASTP